MRHRRGLSFLELMLAMTITFVAVSFLLGMFIYASRASSRSRQLEVANFLAQGAMERLLVTPLGKISSGASHFTNEFTDYTYRVEVTNPGDFDGDGTPDPLRVLRLTVTAPSGPSITLTALRRKTQPLLGVTDTTSGSDAVLAVYCDRAPGHWNGSVTIYNRPLGASPSIGDVAADSKLSRLWVVDTSSGALRSLVLSPLSGWSPPMIPPSGADPVGLASTADGSTLWMTDDSNNALWSYNTAGGTWKGPLIPPGGLEAPRGVGVSSSGTTVWVADAGANALRLYQTSGGWCSTLYTTPGLSSPQGVAVANNGGTVFTDDANYLYIYKVSSGTWTRIGLDPKLISDGPAGIACSEDGSIVYIDSQRGGFFKYVIGAGLKGWWWPGM